MVTPPASAIVENRLNGGLFTAATRSTRATRAILTVARDINDAIKPYNDWVAARPALNR